MWKEYDTYKIATVANSCSTMHKITSTPIDANSFCLSAEDVDAWPDDLSPHFAQPTIELCEWLRQRFNETGNKNYWRADTTTSSRMEAKAHMDWQLPKSS